MGTKNNIWEAWESQLEALPAFADEWGGDLAEQFIERLENLASRRRDQRESALQLSREIQDVHVMYEELLVFFGIEAAFLRWSVRNCPGDDVERARLALAEWSEVLRKYSGVFPASEAKMGSYEAMRNFWCQAQNAAALILAGFHAVDSCLAPPETFERQAAA